MTGKSQDKDDLKGETTNCCTPSMSGEPQSQGVPSKQEEVRSLVRQRYGPAASNDSACCGNSISTVPMSHLGYTSEQAAALPDGADLGLGCGNPLAHAEVSPGETVLDLGSGAGIDAFLAAREVGPSGRVIGVDMTHEMLARARDNVRKVNAENVEFRLGEIENLPVSNASIDLIISNCVVNLSPDKPRVFREALRVLKPGGRLVVSDLVLLAPLPASIAQSIDAYVGCVAGASLLEDYLQHMRDAGFSNVEVLEKRSYKPDGTPEGVDAQSKEWHEAFERVVSVKVRGMKTN